MNDKPRTLIPVNRTEDHGPIVQPMDMATEGEREAYKAAMIALARNINSNRDLRRTLRGVQPHLRQAVYTGVKPYLTFKALSYTLVKP
jgi:hypothetical protein